MTTCNDPVCCYPPIGRETENRIKMIRSMEQAYKKRSPRATANSPPVLADMGKLLYKSVNFKTTTKIYLTQLSMHYFIYCYTINSFKSSLSCFQLGKNRFNKAVYSSLCKRTLICNNSCTTMYSIHGSGFFINSRLKIIFRVR